MLGMRFVQRALVPRAKCGLCVRIDRCCRNSSPHIRCSSSESTQDEVGKNTVAPDLDSSFRWPRRCQDGDALTQNRAVLEAAQRCRISSQPTETAIKDYEDRSSCRVVGQGNYFVH